VLVQVLVQEQRQC